MKILISSVIGYTENIYLLSITAEQSKMNYLEKI